MMHRIVAVLAFSTGQTATSRRAWTNARLEPIVWPGRIPLTIRDTSRAASHFEPPNRRGYNDNI
jgi:hypothetical protein